METLTAPVNDLFGEAARLLFVRHPKAAKSADFSGLTVLVPNFHAATALCRAMAAGTTRFALIPPRIFTFPAWADAAPLPSALPNSQRIVLLYQALKSWGRFEERQLWPMCAELLSLFEELTHYRVSLPDEVADFSRRLREAYDMCDSPALDFEARLLIDSWFALSRPDGSLPDAAARHIQGLAWQAEHHHGPLYVLGVTQLSPAERECLERIAARETVTRIMPDVTQTGFGRLLTIAWAESPSLIERAQAVQGEPVPSLPLRLFPANSLEEEAQAACAQIRLWLAAGKRSIVVVVQDRLTARRTRALLERAEVLVEDETGWPLSTTAAASAVMRWIEVNANGFMHEDTLDLLKSPFVLNTWSDELLHEGIAQLENELRKAGPAPGLAGLKKRARESGSSHAIVLIATLERAAELLAAKHLPLARWCLNLRESLRLLDMECSLEADEAGRQLLDQLAQSAQELADDETRYTFSEWWRWLAQQWESTNFIDPSVESPVVFTHLAATRLRMADAILILGADAFNLPSLSYSPFFNQRVRASLGLPDWANEQAQTENDLLYLLSSEAEALIAWRAQQNGEQIPLSPWFARLESFCRLAWGKSLTDTRLRDLILPTVASDSSTTRPPKPVLTPLQVPTRISPSGYNQLVACPYQYFASRVLGLEALEDIDTELDKRDYGETVHAILNRFHSLYPRLCGIPHETLLTALNDISRDEFARFGEDIFAQAWLRRWQKRLPDYLAWQRAREQSGWHWQAGEKKRSKTFVLNDGSRLELVGTLDRIDHHDGNFAVLDYKTAAAASLRQRLALPGEDTQLPSYALLLDEPVSLAAYIAIDEDSIREIAPPQDITILGKAIGERLVSIFNRLRSGAPLPAQGTETACAVCAMRGLCRKDFWLND